MQISVINSGSSGNGYVLEVNDDILLIECGVNPKEMLKAVDFKTGRVSGCIVSHQHQDHIGYLSGYSKYGFPILMTEESKGDKPVKTMSRMKKNKIDNFTVIPFKVPHNETECDGFLIKYPGMETLLFITDAEMCPYDMSKQGINHVMVECNYSEKYVDIDEANKEHVFRGHMELETCKRFIRSIYGDNLKSIGLIHLSSKNADPVEFRKEIEKEFPGVFVWIAEKGMKVDLQERKVI